MVYVAIPHSMPLDNNRLRTLDLFSGIGGFSLALKSICRTVAYCEIDPFARQVLLTNMGRDIIEKAVIYEDVKDLPIREVADLKPEFITAGFPCQDFSVLSRENKGLRGSRSSLIYSVLELLEHLPTVEHIMLENSPCAVGRGLERILHQLTESGFVCIWGTYTARDVGAPHLRNRFYCVASKAPEKLKLCKRTGSKNWPAEPFPRVMKKTTTKQGDLERRWRLLGNAVVPAVVQFAYNSLLAGFERLVLASPRGKTFRNALSNRRLTIILPGKHSQLIQISKSSHSLPEVKVSIKLGSFEKKLWATPVSSTLSSCKTLTERCRKNLPTVIFHEQKTQEYMSSNGENSLKDAYKRWTINPYFIEWLMGYPKNYTGLN